MNHLPQPLTVLSWLALGALIATTAHAQTAAAPRAAAASVQPANTATPVRYEASVQGVRSELLLQRNGERLSGQFTESGKVLPLRGLASGTRLSGRIEGPAGSGLSMPFEADVDGDALHLRLSLAPGQPAAAVTMHRVGAAPSNNGSATRAVNGGALDPALIGRWVRETVINSPGGAGGFASFATVRTLTLAVDGRVRQTVRSAGGGGSWSHAGGEQVEFSGRWQVRGADVWVQPEGQAQFVAASRYAIVDARLVLTTAQGRQIWTR